MMEPLKTYHALIMTDNARAIARLERKAGVTQAEAVTEFIDNTCWGEDVPQFRRGRGSPIERLTAIRAAFRAQESE